MSKKGSEITKREERLMNRELRRGGGGGNGEESERPTHTREDVYIHSNDSPSDEHAPVNQYFHTTYCGSQICPAAEEKLDISLDLDPQYGSESHSGDTDIGCYNEHECTFSGEDSHDHACDFSYIHSTKSGITMKSSVCDDMVGLVVSSAHYSFTSLPDDVLFLIFSYLQPKELCSICCVCRRLRLLASKDSVWKRHARRTAVVKNSSNCRQCSEKELCRVAPNWRLGRLKENFAVRHRTKLLPWVEKNDDGLWFSTGSSIRLLKVCSSGYLREEKDKCLSGMEDDATRFLQKNNMVVSGCRDGSVYGWETSGKPLFCYKQVHRSDTQCVDLTDAVIITGSRDATCKVLPLDASVDGDSVEVRSFDAGERVWSLRISPCERYFVAGLAGYLDDPPVIMWDIESGECIGQLGMNHRRGAGVLDLKFESPHELLTCGYDTFVRMWDLRTQTCVAQWEEPYDSAVYCIESDGANTILVGTARHGMARLWDKRKTEPVQAYYSHNQSSPVYSLAMDYGHIYLALDMGLNVMDFTAWRSDPQTLGPSTSSQHFRNTNHSRRRHVFKR